MKACVTVVIINVVLVLAQQPATTDEQNPIYENNQYYFEESNDAVGDFNNNDLNDHGVYYNRHSYHHHHHHQNIYGDYGNANSFEGQEVPVKELERNSYDAKLRFFNDSMDNYIELPLNRAADIFSTSWYNASRSTVLFAHGYTGHPNGPAVTSVINAYLNLGDRNVILFNWDKLAAGSPPSLASTYINFAMPNSRKLGIQFAQTLKQLSWAGMNLNKTHFIGHSLGAHIFGIAGNALQSEGIQLPWITGLDPAAYGFENRPSLPQLNSKSATFVAVIHSDPSKYGFRKSLGTADFWLNYKSGTVFQPGCLNRASPMFSPTDLCNHNRAWEILVDSLKYPGMLLASYAKNFRQWKNYSVEERKANVLSIGVFDINTPKGNYFLMTNANSPYGRGQDGLF